MNSKLTIRTNFNPLMQRTKQCLLALLICSSVLSYAQNPYYNQRPEFLKANSVWAFGVYAGLDFNSGRPMPITTGMQTYEGSASVADPVTGKLLFYSNGGQVWNANHQQMPNGDSLFGNARVVGSSASSNFSTQQGACIVPVIGDPDKYYLFSLRGWSSGFPMEEGTLFYNVIDMKLDNGLGDIIPGQKNIPLNWDTLGESILTIPGNNCDIWLIVHPRYTDEFKAYHITQGGIDTTPVVSIIRSGYKQHWMGMAISPDRSKIVAAGIGTDSNPQDGGFIIAEFDPNTGLITDTNKITIGSGGGGLSVCFSPDNSKLYALQGPLNQFDLTIYDSAAIANSITTIDSSSGVTMATLKLYNDTIYVLTTHRARPPLWISRVNQPNLAGNACDFQQDAIVFDSTVNARTYSLNSDVVSFAFPPDTVRTLALDTAVCSSEITVSAPQKFVEYTWDDGSTAINRDITESGTYWVLSKDFCGLRIDTFIISMQELIPPVINVDKKTLGTMASYSSYQWMLNGSIIPGATDSTYTVSVNGDYRVIVTNEIGCPDTSGIYQVTNANNIGNKATLQTKIRIYPNPANSRLYIDAPFAVSIKLTDLAGKLVKEEVNIKVITVDELPNGIYLLHISDKERVLLKTEKLVKAE